MSNSNADSTHPPPPPQPSLSSLPDEIVLRCLVRVPRIYHRNISWVSKGLGALVRSPELNVLRSTLIPKSSLHVCFEEEDEDDHSSFHWFTLTKEENGLGFVLNPTPFPPHPSYGSSTAVTIGSKILFIGGSNEPSTDLWILDTRSGNITQGPSMSVPRVDRNTAVGVIDGMVYVLGGGEYNEAIQVEVFDPNLESWELGGVERVRKMSRCSASVEGKVYMVEYGNTSVYNPRGGMVDMVNKRVSEDKLNDVAHHVCVVDDVLFSFFSETGLMWFDAEVNVWRKLVTSDGKELVVSRVKGMSEYEGRIVVFTFVAPTGGVWTLNEAGYRMKNVQCMLVSLDRAGDKICGTIDWSGIVATVPIWFNSHHCLAVSV